MGYRQAFWWLVALCCLVPVTQVCDARPVNLRTPAGAMHVRGNVWFARKNATVHEFIIVHFSPDDNTTLSEHVEPGCCVLLDFTPLKDYDITVTDVPNAHFENSFKRSKEQWNAVVSSLFDTVTFSQGNSNLDQDNVNEVVFGELTIDNSDTALAVTFLYVQTATNELVEWDQAYNTDQFNLGNAEQDSQSYDIETVMLHELGHVASLDDLNDDNCEPTLMYFALGKGEIKSIDETTAACAGGQALSDGHSMCRQQKYVWFACSLVALVLLFA